MYFSTLIDENRVSVCKTEITLGTSTPTASSSSCSSATVYVSSSQSSTSSILSDDLNSISSHCTLSQPEIRSVPQPSGHDYSKIIESIKSLFPENTIIHSHYRCSVSPCSLPVLKTKRVFKHKWCSDRDLTYDKTSNIWWLLYEDDKGMYCFLCRKHHATNKQNKQKTFGLVPAVRYQIDALRDHAVGQKHKDAVEAEMIRRVSVFDKALAEKTSLQTDVLHAAFTALYWLVQVGMAYRNFRSLLNMMRIIGLQKLTHFQHESLWSTRGMLLVIAEVVKENILKDVQDSSCFGIMVDDVTDIAVMEQNVIFIQYFSKTTHAAEIKFLAVNNLLEGDATNANANTITKCILSEVARCNLSTDQLTSIASDGAAVMVGRKNGVATQLKKVNPKLINIHCVCHKLALACGDANDTISYVKEFESLLLQLWKFFEYSCVRTAAFLKAQLALAGMNVPKDEKKRQLIGRKLQKACRTRWLSLDKSVQGVFQDYVAILLTLNQFDNDATGSGLRHKLRKMKFLSMLYIMKEVLPVLAKISKCFQRGMVSFAAIEPTISMAKDTLDEIVDNETPLKVNITNLLTNIFIWRIL